MAQYDLPYTGPQVETLLAKISELESEMPSKTSDLTNDSGFITSSDVPTKTSDLNNDSGFITNAPVAAEAARAQAAEALLATISSLQAEISRATGVEGTLQDLIDGIAAKIPSAATEQNQLADKAFVNSSIATASATFRGTYISLVALQAVAADENDYGYVISTDAVGNTIYNRYKYANSTWTFEYAIANPIFDSSQWAAINSAVTAELVAKLSALPDNATLTEALAAKQDVIDDLSSIRSKANSAYQKPSGGIPASDIADGVIPDISGKVNTSDIADNLTTNDATKVLSAKQGKVLNENLTQLGQDIREIITLGSDELFPESMRDADNFSAYFESGKFIYVANEYSASVWNLAQAAAMYLDKTKMIKLHGGCLYHVKSFYYSGTVGAAVYDDNLQVVKGYSVSAGNGTNLGGYVLGYDVDLTNEAGVFYLRITVSNTQTDIVKYSVEPDKTYLNKEKLSSTFTWADDFKTAKNPNLIVKSGTYGQSGATYLVKRNSNIGRLAVDFRIDTDVNTALGKIVMALAGGKEIGLYADAPSLLQEKYVNDDLSYVQDIGYLSRVYFDFPNNGQIRKVTDTQPLVGNTSLMIWLKGDTSNTEPTAEDVSTRATWLENNQDYVLKIESDTLSIIRNGVANDGSTFNGGATSTIFTTSLKNNGVYKSLGALYTELSALDYLVVKMMDMSADKDCGDLAQFGSVRMVGRYNQQIDRTSSTVGYYYDSYPIPIRFKLDESWHTLEILSMESVSYVIIDGKVWTYANPILGNIQLGVSGITLANLEVWDGCFGDDALFNDANNIYSSKRTPCLFTYMGHQTYNTYEGSDVIPVSDEVSQSAGRLNSLCAILKRNEYSVLELSKLGEGVPMEMVKKNGTKNALFIFDDLAFRTLYMNKDIRRFVSIYGYSMNFAVIHDYVDADTDAKNEILPMRLNGWCCCTHSLKHDVPIPRKNSVILYWELQQILDDCDRLNLINNVFVYNWSGKWANTYNMLQMCGFACAIDSSGGVTRMYNNRYNMLRYNIADNSSNTLAALEAALVK